MRVRVLTSGTVPARKRQPADKPPRKPRADRINTERAQAMVVTWLSLGLTKGEVKRELNKQYRTMSPRTAEDIISAARELMVKASGISEDEHRDRAYNFYRTYVINPKKGDWVRLKAQERIDKLLALEGPVKVELSGGLTHTARVAAAVLSDERARALLDELDEVFAAKRAAPSPTSPQEVPDVARDPRPSGDNPTNAGNRDARPASG